MAKRIDTQARIEAVRLQDQGSPPAAPAAGYSLVFAKADGLYLETTAGAVIGPFITGSAVASSSRTLIEEKTPNGTGTVSFSGIPGTYEKLVIEGAIRSTNATAWVNALIQFNGDSTGTNYRYIYNLVYGTTSSAIGGGNDCWISASINAATAAANEFSHIHIEILQYTNTGFNKQAFSDNAHKRDTSSVYELRENASVAWNNTAAISRVDLLLSAGNYVANSVLRLYGEN